MASKSSSKRSVCWKFFEEISTQEARCNLCPTTLKTKNGSTTSLNRHLLSRHLIQYEEEKRRRQPKDITPQYPDIFAEENDGASVEQVAQPSTTPTSSQAAARPTSTSVQPKINSAMESQTPYGIRHPRKIQLDRKVLDLIVIDLQPLSVVEDKAFRALLYAMDKRYTMIARHTLRDVLLPKVYKERKSALFLELAAVDHVGITTDQWTSRATEGYTTVTCHYVKPDWTLASPVLATQSTGERHNGENMAEELKDIFKTFGIQNKVTSVVTDNAKNAKKAVRITKHDNQPCFAHTLNLIVSHALEDDESNSDIKKVKDIVAFFKLSVNATKDLRDLHNKNSTEFKKLKNAVKTRWNSTYIMLRSFLHQHKEVKSILCIHDKHDLTLTDAAIERLKQTMTTLEPFFIATEELSTEKHTSISKVLTLVKILQSNNNVSDSLSQSLKDYIDLYLGASEDRPLLRQASFLDPRYRDYGFSRGDSLDKTKSELTEKMLMNQVPEEKKKDESLPEPPPAKKTNALWKLFDDNADVEATDSSHESVITAELKLYSEAPRLNRLADPLQWWRRYSMRLPNLAKLAKEILAVPATSVPSERVFSKAGELISAKRSRLGKGTVNMVLFLNKLE